MKCPKYGDMWCVYWFGGKCNYDFTEVESCLEPRLSPIGCEGEWVWDMMSEKELAAQIDVMKMVIKSARPNDPHNSMDRAECDNAKYACEMDLYYAIKVYEEKTGVRDGLVETRKTTSEEDVRGVKSSPDLLVESPSLPTKLIEEVEGEWV